MKIDFSKSFNNSDCVILCPIYAAGEKKIGNFNMENFARLIAKNSKVQVVTIQNKEELRKYFKKILLKMKL